MAERSSSDVNILSIPVPIRRGGSESNLDVVDSVGDDGVGLDFTKGALGIDSLQQKILKVTEQIKVEQTARDQNVAEYLKLVNNADKQQVGRIRQVFEKKNQKSAHTIARLQRKLEQYHRRVKDNETNGKHNHKDGSSKESGTHSKEGSLRDVSATGRHPALDKVKTIGPGVSLSPPFFFNKSREFANLIRNKFGSADNIAHLKSSMETGSGLHVDGGARGLSGSATTVAKATKYQSDDECSTGTSASGDSNGNLAGGSGAGSGGPGRSDSNGRLGEVLDMVREIREAQAQLADDMENLNSQFKRDYSYFTQMMQEERYRYERLEDQLNDLTELHQHETSDLKQELASIEEKVAYQAYERARDIQAKPCSRICPAGESDPQVSPSQSNSDFSHPVYKEIALANGHINRMSKEELRIKLAELRLDTRGVKDVMKKRLKSHYKKQKLMQSAAEGGPTDTYYDYICVVDFEATCEEDNPADFHHEIIEFPMVLINTHTLEIVDTFQEYVKPELNPQLSDFCVKLTGITQKMVDDADPFPEVLQRVVDWLQERELGTKYKYAILTDGAWDMSKFLNIQCRISRIRYPHFAKKWINIRKSYGNFYKVPRTQTKLSTMLEKLGLKYEGRPHSGLDDSRNIAKIALRMLQDGCQLRVNERMHAGKLLSVPSSAPVEGAPPPHTPRTRE